MKDFVVDYGAHAGGDLANPDNAAMTAFRDAAIAGIRTSAYTTPGRNNRRGTIDLYIPPGEYVITQPDAMGQLLENATPPVAAAGGLTIRGAGRQITKIVYAPPPDTTNYLFSNDVWQDVHVADLTLVGWPDATVQSTRDADRFPGFMRSKVKAGTNAVANYTFERVRFDGFWRECFSLEGDDNNSEMTFVNCGFYAAVRNFMWAHGSSQPLGSDQFVNYDFYSCQAELLRGNVLRFDKGGNVNVWGGSWIGAVDTPATLPASTLGAAAGASDTTIQLASATGFPPSGLVRVESETIRYSSIAGSTLNVAERGAERTVAASHSAAVPVTFGPDAGAMIWLTERYHDTGTTRLSVMGTRFETRSLNSVVLDSSWAVAGTILFQSTDHVAGHVAATHTPYVVRHLDGSPAVRFDSCRLPYRQRHVWGGGATWNKNREVHYENCEFRDWQRIEDVVVFENVGVPNNVGAKPAIRFTSCRGSQDGGDAYKRPFEGTLGWRDQNHATLNRRIVRLTRGDNKFPQSGETIDVYLPLNSVITSIFMYMGATPESGVTASATGWQFDLKDEAGTVHASLASPTVPPTPASAGLTTVTKAPLYLVCNSDLKRHLLLVPNANVNQHGIGDCLIEYFA